MAAVKLTTGPESLRGGGGGVDRVKSLKLFTSLFLEIKLNFRMGDNCSSN